MNSQHLTDDLCLDYLNGELPVVEMPSLECHLDQCPECRQKVEEYRTILRSGLSVMVDEVVENAMFGSLPWSIEEGEKRLYAALKAEAAVTSPARHVELRTKDVPQRMPSTPLAKFLLSPNLRPNLAVGASLVLASALGMFVYRIGVKQGREQSRIATQSENNSDAAWRERLEKLASERVQIEASLRERETIISRLRSQVKEQTLQLQALEASLQSAKTQSEEDVAETRQASLQREELARKFEDQRVVLAAEQKKFDTLQQAETNDALRVVSLENQIQQISQLAKDRERTIDEQQRLLAADRDIRELMGARNLYIAEVSDVGTDGKNKKPYGRVFYTKGKSLIFYGYDLDQEPDLKDAGIFQAWGMRGPDRNSVLKLGVMYIDNTANKRWVLRFDDPKVLAEINAVFVTVEPNGESRVPRGKQVLSAVYLKEEPNHP